MKTKLPSAYCILPSSFCLLLLALLTTAPRAPAQSTVWSNAVSLNGTNQYVALPKNTWFSNDLTIEAWVYERSYKSQSRVIDFGNGTPSDNVVFSLSVGTSGQPYFQVCPGGQTGRYAETTTPLPLNQWVHLAATLRGTTGIIYFDGIAVATNTIMSQPAGVIRTNNYIGRSNWSPDAYANAVFDELRIWNVARTPAQIQDGMCHPLTGSEPNLVAYYPFNEGTGTIAHDATANHLDGTLYNSPVWTNSTIPPFINITSWLAPGLPGVCYSSVAWGDYDNDGRLDILLTGAGAGYNNPIAQVWHNNDNGTFSNINAGLPGVIYSSVAWGDYDNDGWLDILLTGLNVSPNEISQVWHNNGDGTFSNINAGLPGDQLGSVAWGDYDNDGKLDILLSGGLMQNESGLSQVWHNNGDGTFSNINAGLLGVAWGSVAWGDYDNDGRLDILLTGGGLEGAGDLSQVWRNNGDGTFSNINAGLPGVIYSSAAWGDYDNDGLLDILLTGQATDGSAISQVWHNNGDGTFSNINVGLPGVMYGSVAWGDYDNDGRLDILLTGTTNGLASGAIAQIWHNNGDGTFSNINAGLPGVDFGSVAWGDYDNDGRLDILLTGQDVNGNPIAQVWRNIGPTANTPPTAPANLAASVAGPGVSLTWTAASDVQTPANGLTYNLCVGTTPGGSDIVSPEADPVTGFRRLPARGNLQPGVTAQVTNLPLGTFYWSVQAVDTAFAGSPFSAEGSFLIWPPQAETLAATNVTSTEAILPGAVNLMTQPEAIAWFEYGLTIGYGSATVTTNLGSGMNTVPFQLPATDVLPWMTYHYRAVASNSIGVTVGADAIVTLSGPSVTAPSLSALPNVTLAQGGSTSVWFTVSPSSLDVQVRCSNPVLLPPAGLTLGGSGTSSRSLAIVPATAYSGSAQVTVTATDGSTSVSSMFNLTVTPAAGQAGSLLSLTNPHVVSTQAWRFQLVDAGTGSTNYAVQYRSDLSPTNTWMPATNVTALGGNVFEVAIGPPQPRLGFYRAEGFRLLMANLNSAALTVEKGAGPAGPVLVFNGIYTGTVTCIWTDQQGINWTNVVQVNGTTAVIPIPASYLTDDATLGQLEYLTLQVQVGTGFALGATTQGTIMIQDNNTEWQGVLQTPSGALDFGLTMIQTTSSLQGQIQSDGFGFFPTNALVQLNFTEDAFTAVATNIPLPTLAAYPQGFTNYLDLRLDATNGPGVTNVSPTQILGTATLVSKVPNARYLDAAVYGTFQLLKPPPAPATNQVPLTPAP